MESNNRMADTQEPSTAAFLDPEFASMLADLPEFTFSEETLPLMRALMPDAGPPASGVERTDHVVDDGPVVVSVHRPAGESGALPCVVWMHGGGTIIGNRHLDNAQLERWCKELSVCSVSVEYRLAPEHPYPAPLEDCYQAFCWTIAHAGEIGVDPSRVGVGGKSAGGLLAAALALLVRDRSGPEIRCQILDCPMLDDRLVTPSSKLAAVPLWSREDNEFGWRCYLGSLYGTADIPRTAVPARAAYLDGLPPAFVSVGTVDVLRDEDVEYALRLNQAGVPTELHVYLGVPHGTAMFPGLAANEPMITDMDRFFRRILVAGVHSDV
jgi:acetyl esterase/lipase